MDLLIVQNKYNRGDSLLLPRGAGDSEAFVPHEFSAGPRDRQVAAGTGLCHQLPQGHPAPPDCHSQGAAPAPSHGTKGTRGLPDPGTPPRAGDLCAAPPDPGHQMRSVGHSAQPQGGKKGSNKGCCGCGASCRWWSGTTSPPPPRAPSPSCCTENWHQLTWFQPVFLHD